MSPEPDWRAKHFGVAEVKAKQPEPPRKQRFIVAFASVALVTSAAGAVAGSWGWREYTGVWPWEGDPASADFGVTYSQATSETSPEPTKRPPAASRTPTDDAGWRDNLGSPRGSRLPEAPEIRAPHADVSSLDDVTVQHAAADDTSRIQSLRRGIDLMTREQNDARNKIASLETEFRVRPRGSRGKPWSDAEVVDEANLYLGQQNLTQFQRLHAIEQQRNASARLTNARQRIKELNNKMQSLQSRIDKAKSELP